MVIRKLLVFASIISVIFISGCSKCKIELPNGYKWKENSGYSMVVNSVGDVVIGPGAIELWAKYPWLYGDISNKDGISQWALNMESNEYFTKMTSAEFAKFAKKWNIKMEHSRVTIWTVSEVGDLQNKGLILEFKKACMPNIENK